MCECIAGRFQGEWADASVYPAVTLDVTSGSEGQLVPAAQYIATDN